MKECNGCGKCCILYGGSSSDVLSGNDVGGLYASAEEIESWEIFRPDIYAYVDGDKLWVDPKTKELLANCPFLRATPIDSSLKNNTARTKYTCDIYDDRPEDCRHYPTRVAEMVRDECEMIEVKDLTDPRKAQKKLDEMMSDSRPSVDKS